MLLDTDACTFVCVCVCVYVFGGGGGMKEDGTHTCRESGVDVTRLHRKMGKL